MDIVHFTFVKIVLMKDASTMKDTYYLKIHTKSAADAFKLKKIILDLITILKKVVFPQDFFDLITLVDLFRPMAM